MLALYRAGRRAEALAAYREARQAFMDELGLDLGPELRRLEQAIFRNDPSLNLSGNVPGPRSASMPAAISFSSVSGPGFHLSQLPAD